MIQRGETVPVSIEDEMKTAYLDYAMSVIIGRALPDIRDGLKPVHRRVLYAMYREGLLPGRKYAKCARVVGEVIGKYHPHGEMAVYDTLVRMAQDFNLRYPLVEGQGNFGSIDGDTPAAYRYTEARLSRIALELLEDLDKDTVDFTPNFDETLNEPIVMPGKLPNLLVNGSEGIAVGMSTHIPPHNLTEVCNALTYFIDHPDATVEDLVKFIQGPDFPTGGIAFTREQILRAYSQGKGVIRIRARMEIENLKKQGREAIIIHEIPYQISKADVIEEIAGLVRDKKIEGIHDIRDESNRQGIRVVIELKKGENPDVIMNLLYQHTRLEISYGMQLLAIDNLRPRLMNLAQLLDAYLRHRKEVILRRTSHELRQARHRAHIVEGLVRAVDIIDEVITTIRNAASVPDARHALTSLFGFSEIQAQAILDMQLQRLTGLERRKLTEELTELHKTIKTLEFILATPEEVHRLIKEDLEYLKKQFGDGRRTAIQGRLPTIHEEDFIREETVVITATEAGYIKRSPLKTFTLQRRGGKGRIGMAVREEDNLAQIIVASTLDYLNLFFDSGRVYQLRVHEIPEMGTNSLGRALVNLLPVRKEENLVGLIRLPYNSLDRYRYVLLVTVRGRMKRLPIDEILSIPRGGRKIMRIHPSDKFLGAHLTDGHMQVFAASSAGRGVLFPEQEISIQSRSGSGIRGMRVRGEDRVVSVRTIDKESHSLFLVSSQGYGKKLLIDSVPKHHRGTSGVFLIRLRKKGGSLADALNVKEKDKIMVTTESGMAILIAMNEVAAQGRSASGVRIINVDPGDRVRRVAVIPE